MAEITVSQSVTQFVLDSLGKGLKRDEIVAHLKEEGHEERFVKEIVSETVKLRNSRLRSQGLTLILIGAIMCLFSCVITVANSSLGGNFSMVLFGLTSVGVVFIFAGFAKIF